MAEKKEVTLRAVLREGRGKNDARRARRDGQVPVTIYGGEGGTVAALASLRELAAILRSDSGRNTIFTLDIEGVGASEVMFADRQIDPVRMRLIGEPIGVREHAGVLEQIVRNVEIRCEPRDIPEVLEVDVTNLGVHEVLHISDIPANEKIEILEDANAVIATVGIVKEEEVVVAPVEGEVPAEPEVIGKGKKEEEGEAPAEEEKEKEKK